MCLLRCEEILTILCLFPTASASTTFVQKRGFIYKLGGKVKSWKLRYFVLHPGYFCYYKDPSVSERWKGMGQGGEQRSTTVYIMPRQGLSANFAAVMYEM